MSKQRAVKHYVMKIGVAAGLLISVLMIWRGLAEVTGWVRMGLVVQVRAESQTLTYQLHPAIPALTIVTKEPWELTARDLTSGRIWYNLLTKPGFRWLAMEGLIGLIMVILAWQASWKLIKWSQATRRIAIPDTMVRTRANIFKPGLVVEIAGTVKIGTSAGIIYQAWETLTQSGERELAFILGKLPVIRIAAANRLIG